MPPDNAPAPNGAIEEELYGAAYYASHCGSVPYERNDHWLGFFGRVADELQRAFAPQTVFDAGCALGLLVESLWDRGIETHGRDISAWAIEHARPDIRGFCSVGSIAEPIDGQYDLLTCIEVLEHIPEPDALRAISEMAKVAPRILFSSSPIDFEEPTHCNVRPISYWLARWAETGFAPLTTHDAGYLAPHAYILERSETGRTPRELGSFADRIRHRVALAGIGAKLASTEHERSAACEKVAALSASIELLQDQMRKREIEDRRLRAASAQRAAEAREQADKLRIRIAAMSSAASTHQASPKVAAESNLQLQKARAELRSMTAERDRLLNSTIWRGTWPLRVIAERMPSGLRSVGRRLLSAAWWLATGQLGTRLRERRRIVQDVALVSKSAKFNAGWYAGRYSDVGPSGLDPALHYVTIGGPENRDPGPDFSADAYGKSLGFALPKGTGALVHFLRNGQPRLAVSEAPSNQKPAPANTTPPPASAEPTPVPAPVETASRDILQPSNTIDARLRERFAALVPLRTFRAPHDEARITIVTDSIAADSLYGGVATSFILAALLAKRLNASLRLVTRTRKPDSLGEVASLLGIHGIAWSGNIEVCHSPPDDTGQEVPVAPSDIFLTTSWWTTWATSRSIKPSRMAYLLQEDERGFYPLGDDHLRCSEMLLNPELLYLVNTGLLLEHLQDAGLAPGAIAFEPAFPEQVYHREERTTAGKKSLFFYARPNNPRNLYWRGLEALRAAIEEQVFDPQEWDFNFVGLGTEALILPGGATPRLTPRMAWPDYASFIRRMDIGLSLMDTPHPSYPPLDLAASGAVVVTNRFGRKQTLDNYSPNILCVEPTVSGLLDGLRDGAKLAADPVKLAANFARNGLQRDWERSLAPALDGLVDRFKG